jgi:hypothetical protein
MKIEISVKGDRKKVFSFQSQLGDRRQPVSRNNKQSQWVVAFFNSKLRTLVTPNLKYNGNYFESLC